MAKPEVHTFEPNFLDKVDCFIEIYKEKIPDNGEDAYLYSGNSSDAVIGAFDGCGGAGAKRHTKLQGKTSAYAASRIVSGTIKDWFAEYDKTNSVDPCTAMKQRISQNLQACDRVVGEESKLVSPMVKRFPTTAAIALLQDENGKVLVDYFWAGDSRVYLLDSEGLAQLSCDDLPNPDALENLYNDGVMTNLISRSKEYTIHQDRLTLEKPGIVFAATDGCFGYVSSPMEFEYLLLETLLASKSVREWEENLTKKFGRVAGDDYTLSGIALNYGSFQKMRSSFIVRGNALYRDYIDGIHCIDKNQKMLLWNKYKQGYYRFLAKSVERK